MNKEEKYLQALREIDNHIRSTNKPLPHIVKTLLNTLPEYEVNNDDIKDFI